jgi:hypothetical protein
MSDSGANPTPKPGVPAYTPTDPVVAEPDGSRVKAAVADTHADRRDLSATKSQLPAKPRKGDAFPSAGKREALTAGKPS